MGAATGAIVDLGASVIGAGVSIYGGIQEAKAQRQQAKFNQEIANRNKARALAAAQDAERRGKQEALRKERSARQLVSRQRAVLAANGMDVASGSSVDLMRDTLQIGKADAMTIRENARREADEFRAQGENFDSEAAMLAKVRKNSSGFTSALGPALRGLGTVAEKWYTYDEAGVFG